MLLAISIVRATIRLHAWRMDIGITQWKSFDQRIMKHGECWIWTGSLTDGTPTLGGKSVRRRLFDRIGRTIPDGMVIAATCDEKLCVNPGHLTVKSWGVINNEKRKNFSCGHDGCDRKAVVNQLCRGHYHRQLKGVKATGKFRIVDPTRGCAISDCGKQHYGEGFCRPHHRQVTMARRKRTLIDEFGPNCADCGGSFHHSAIDFHHLDPSIKENSVSAFMASTIDAAREEARKCVVLCSNCHRVRHASSDVDAFL